MVFCEALTREKHRGTASEEFKLISIVRRGMRESVRHGMRKMPYHVGIRAMIVPVEKDQAYRTFKTFNGFDCLSA